MARGLINILTLENFRLYVNTVLKPFQMMQRKKIWRATDGFCALLCFDSVLPTLLELSEGGKNSYSCVAESEG